MKHPQNSLTVEELAFFKPLKILEFWLAGNLSSATLNSQNRCYDTLTACGTIKTCKLSLSCLNLLLNLPQGAICLWEKNIQWLLWTCLSFLCFVILPTNVFFLKNSKQVFVCIVNRQFVLWNASSDSWGHEKTFAVPHRTHSNNFLHNKNIIFTFDMRPKDEIGGLVALPFVSSLGNVFSFEPPHSTARKMIALHVSFFSTATLQICFAHHGI